MIPLSISPIIQVCARLGVQHAVLSPGSRSAPLTIAFVRHPDIATKTISDERSAAFIGLGMAQQLQQPVSLVCTSGSAAYNYAPAVAEAFFQHVPLIVFTADRPPEWIDQLDGQTIRQRGIYGQHVKASYELPVGQTEDDLWHAKRLVSEAINLSHEFPAGPVHINVPIREPFYPAPDEVIDFGSVKAITTTRGTITLYEEQLQQLAEEWSKYDTKLIVGGQGTLDRDLLTAIAALSESQQLPVVADMISNLHTLPTAVQQADALLASKPQELSPDLLITFGRSVMSKNLKLLLRKHRPKAHWHVQPNGLAADTFQSLSRVIHADPIHFFRQMQAASLPVAAMQPNYAQQWHERSKHTHRQLRQLFDKKDKVGEFDAVRSVLRYLPNGSDIHLANSMSVRYANIIGLSQQHSQTSVFANRGTSGIDGSNSTAVGSTLASDRLTVLVTGDMAFFYDRNAFWHKYALPNLRVVLLNNHGGGIFRLINGPSQQPELDEYFETKQPLTAERTAQDFGMHYRKFDLTGPETSLQDTYRALEDYLPVFYQERRAHASILEIITDSSHNQAIYTRYQQTVAKL